MRAASEFLKRSGGRFAWTAAVFFCAALVPEYVLPVLCIAAYCASLRGAPLLSESPQKVLLAFLLWAAAGWIYAQARLSALVILAEWALFFPLLALTRAAVDDRQKLKALLLCGAGAGGAAGGIGVMQMLLFHTVPSLGKWFNPFWHFLDILASKAWFRLLPQPLWHLMPRREFISIQTRASGTFTNPVFFAAFLCMMLPLCVHCVLFLRTRYLRVFGIVCLALCAGGIAASYSRGPYLALAVCFAVMLFYGRRYAWKLLCGAAGALLIVAAAASGVFRRLLTVFNGRDLSVRTHADIWRACVQMLRGHWLFGYGTGVGGVRQTLQSVYGIAQPHAHNILLEILLENGLIGLALFLCSLALFLRGLLRLARRGGEARRVAVTLLASVAAFAACGMTDYLFYGMKPMCYILLLLGLSLCAQRVYAPSERVQANEVEKELLRKH